MTDPKPLGAQAVDKPNLGLPITTYIWFALLCLGGVLSRVPGLSKPEAAVSTRAADAAGVSPKKATAKRADSTSAEDFSNLVQVETATRGALAGPALARLVTNVARGEGRTTGAPAPSRPADPKRSSAELTQRASKETRALAKRLKSVNIARRVLVLEHAIGLPLDTAWIDGTLTENLRGRGKSATDIAAEQQFWRGLYGTPAITPLRPDRQDELVKSMELGLLGDKLQADLARARGNTAQADRLDAQVEQTAFRSSLGASGLVLVTFLAGVVGVGLTIYLIIIANGKNWKALHPAPLPELAPDFGTLIDCFVFYFALLWLLRPLLSLLASAVLPQGKGSGSVGLELVFTSASYVLIHVLAAIYTAFALRRRGLRLSDIGFHSRALGTNIGVGILGYCAVLPTIWLLATISGRLLSGNPNLTPNPALPLLASSEGLGQKLLMFLLVAVAAPLCEEFFFRGVLYTGLRARFGIVASVVISAALFAIGHPLHDWLPIFGLGMALALMRELRQSLVPGMTAHFVQNAGAFASLSIIFSR